MTDDTTELERLERAARVAIDAPFDMHGGYGRCRGLGEVWVDDGEASNFYRGGVCQDCRPAPKIEVRAETVLSLLSTIRDLSRRVEEGGSSSAESAACVLTDGTDPVGDTTLEVAKIISPDAFKPHGRGRTAPRQDRQHNRERAMAKAGQIVALLVPAQQLAEWAQDVDPVGAAERDVGRWVYERIGKLMDSRDGTPEAGEVAWLAMCVESIEEYGSIHCAGEELAPFPIAALQASEARVRELENDAGDWKAIAESAGRGRTASEARVKVLEEALESACHVRLALQLLGDGLPEPAKRLAAGIIADLAPCTEARSALHRRGEEGDAIPEPARLGPQEAIGSSQPSVAVRDFVRRFFELRLSEKRALFDRYGLPTGPPDMRDSDRWTEGLKVARERGLLMEMAEAFTTRATTDRFDRTRDDQNPTPTVKGE